MRQVFLIFTMVLASNSFAALTKLQQGFVAKQVQSGNDSVLHNLSVSGQSLQEANVDIETLVNMIQRGDVSALSDPRLNYHHKTFDSQSFDSRGNKHSEPYTWGIMTYPAEMTAPCPAGKVLKYDGQCHKPNWPCVGPNGGGHCSLRSVESALCAAKRIISVVTE